eukprot:2832049-Rhodomonas_salina.1
MFKFLVGKGHPEFSTGNQQVRERERFGLVVGWLVCGVCGGAIELLRRGMDMGMGGRGYVVVFGEGCVCGQVCARSGAFTSACVS